MSVILVSIEFSWYFQLNEISAFIDGTLVYGPNKAWTDGLRLFKNGLLAAVNDTDEKGENYPAYNEIRLPMINPPPPVDHKLKPIKRFFSKLHGLLRYITAYLQ